MDNVNVKAVEILKTALKNLNNGKNWMKGAFHDNGKYCAVGACQQAISDLDINKCSSFELEDVKCNDPYYVAFRALKRYGLNNSVVALNDDQNTTFKDVETMFRKAILYLGG